MKIMRLDPAMDQEILVNAMHALEACTNSFNALIGLCSMYDSARLGGLKLRDKGIDCASNIHDSLEKMYEILNEEARVHCQEFESEHKGENEDLDKDIEDFLKDEEKADSPTKKSDQDKK